MMRARGLSLLCCLLFLGVGRGRAAVPTLDYLFPAGGQRGTNGTVVVTGTLDPWPAKVWCDVPGVAFSATTNKGTFTVSIGTNAPLGPHLVRIFNAEGASEPRIFCVGSVPELAEKEPNSTLRQAQAIEKLPALVNGALQSGGDVDTFSLKLEAGKWFVARVEGQGLASPMDPMLHLFDSKGLRVAFANDTQNLDPILAYYVPQSGTYTLELMGLGYPPEANIALTGGSSKIYRLHLTQGPFVWNALPSSIAAGQKKEVELHGWNLGGSNRVAKFALDASGKDPNRPAFQLEDAAFENSLAVTIDPLPDFMEREPNDKPAEAQEISLPAIVHGRLEKAGDIDRYKVVLKKGDRIDFLVEGTVPGCLLDLVFTLEDGNGKQILSVDDDRDGIPDIKTSANVDNDGPHLIQIRDLFGKGGEDYTYRLRLEKAAPAFAASIETTSLKLEPGKTNEVKVAVARLNGHKEKLLLRARGLPPKVTAKDVEVPEKGGDVLIALVAEPNAEPASVPLQFEVAAVGSQPLVSRTALYPLKPKDWRWDLLLKSADQVWLTVLPKPAPAAK